MAIVKKTSNKATKKRVRGTTNVVPSMEWMSILRETELNDVIQEVKRRSEANGGYITSPARSSTRYCRRTSSTRYSPRSTARYSRRSGCR